MCNVLEVTKFSDKFPRLESYFGWLIYFTEFTVIVNNTIKTRRFLGNESNLTLDGGGGGSGVREEGEVHSVITFLSLICYKSVPPFWFKKTPIVQMTNDSP